MHLEGGILKWNLRPGPFNYKEHAVITVMANAAYAGSAIYATDVLVSQQVFYGQNFGLVSSLPQFHKPAPRPYTLIRF
jgi:hypothetical protein